MERARRRVKAVATSPVPAHVTSLADAATRLHDVAAALTAAEDAGLPLTLAHGAVISDAGYVFRVDGKWVVRTRQLTELTPPDADDDLT